jgi:hypothetical protein
MRCVPKIEFPELRIRHRDYTTVKTVSTVKLLVANRPSHSVTPRHIYELLFAQIVGCSNGLPLFIRAVSSLSVPRNIRREKIKQID